MEACRRPRHRALRCRYQSSGFRADHSHGDVRIGIDKTAPIFERGWAWYDRKYSSGQTIERIVNFSKWNEKIMFGGNTIATGVFSYADSVANFNGMRFWNDVLQKHDDLLGRQNNAGPYEIRSDGRWQVNPEKPIDLRHYVDWAMDEGINGSRFASRRGKSKVRAALRRLAESDPEHTYQCPMDPEKLDAMERKYGDCSRWILNYEGIGERPFFSGDLIAAGKDGIPMQALRRGFEPLVGILGRERRSRLSAAN